MKCNVNIVFKSVFCLMSFLCLCSCENIPSISFEAQRTAEESAYSQFESHSESSSTQTTQFTESLFSEASYDDFKNIFVVEADSEINPLDKSERIEYAEVVPNHNLYASVDGIVYSKDMKALIWCPSGYSSEKVVIPDTVEKIENWAFYNCKNIKEIELGSNVTDIEPYAFSHCVSLSALVLPETVQSVGSYAFEYCAKLTEIILPDNVEEYGEEYMTTWANHVFYNCSSLKKVGIPCNSVLAYFENPSGFYEFENSFIGCNSLSEFIISERADSVVIYDGALATASLDGICRLAPMSDTTIFTIPSQTEALGSYAFEGCTNLKELIIEPYSGSGERKIFISGESTLKDCKNLERLVIPADITDICDISTEDFPKLIIYAEKDSFAEKYAMQNDIPCIIL